MQNATTAIFVYKMLDIGCKIAGSCTGNDRQGRLSPMRTTRRSLLALGGGAAVSLAAGARARGGAGPRAGLARAAGDHDRAVPPGRRDRHLRASAGGGARRAARPDVRRRQPRRGGRHARRRDRRAGGEGRLHALPRRGAPRDRAGGLPEARLRHREGLPADRRRRGRAAGGRGQPGPGRGEDAGRAGRGREGEPGLR